ncbi:cytochrome P450 6B5-like [Aricia agestis]|uniref:cytochrome P450 6B5-like n=1 Tax=Aricia agestis TaxID=91739 RepID=UPI001C20266B|nr:cytochrome P450 6B5-like [Aricia agestis]
MLFLCLVLFSTIILYYFGTRNHDHWKKRGIPYEKPLPFFGSNLKFVFEGNGFVQRFINFHNKYPREKCVGYFQANAPMLLVRDPEMIKSILVTDFRYFHHRGLAPHKEITEPLMKNLFIVDGDLWKLCRQKMSPAFSTAKLKAMFPMIVVQAEKLINVIDSSVQSGSKEMDVRELMARYTTDFIGVCGFGINTDTLQDDANEFRELGRRIFQRQLRDIIVGILKVTSPTLFKNLHVLGPDITNPTVHLVKSIMKQRNYAPSGRHDFIDFMLELKQKGNIVGESIEKVNADGTSAIVSIEVDDELIAAQAFVFFAAGFETSSSSSSFLLHLLAYHPEEQKRCQKEIDDVLKKYDGKLCYDAVRDMKYLEMAFKESLRIFPPVGVLARKNVAKYTFPGTDVTIDEGTGIIMSIHAIQNDEQYFKSADEFIPERFHPDNAKNINKFTFLPFGDGSRACIGERMGQMQALAGVATVLSRFTVTPSARTVRTPRIDPTSTIVSSIAEGLPLMMSRREGY